MNKNKNRKEGGKGMEWRLPVLVQVAWEAQLLVVELEHSLMSTQLRVVHQGLLYPSKLVHVWVVPFLYPEGQLQLYSFED